MRLTHEHGLSASYDEVLRFRKSAAKYMADHENDVVQQVTGLSRNVGPLFSWCDNYDILVCTPKGRRETHCMDHRVHVPAAGEILPGSDHVAESPSTPLIFPRFKKFGAANLDVKNLTSVTLLHYTGPKKVKPPRLSTNFGQPFEKTYANYKRVSLGRSYRIWTGCFHSSVRQTMPSHWSGLGIWPS